MSRLRVAVGPAPEEYALAAIREGGGEVVSLGEAAQALVWLSPSDASGVAAAVAATPGVAWIQLPWAGVEAMAAHGLFNDGRTWTCAKGCYAEPVAEHALLLMLASLRLLTKRARAHTWGSREGLSLYDEPVTILGGGAITTSLVAQLRPFRCPITVVRRNPAPMAGVDRVVATEALHEVLPGALAVVLALALTPATTGIVGAAELAAMDERAVLVNVARGRHVVTDDLVDGLRSHAIAAAGLDVTDPEPLPDDHPLWDLENCLVTPHSADTDVMVRELLAKRIAANVARYAAGDELLGRIDPDAGY